MKTNNTTPTAMNTNETKAPEFSELSHAAALYRANIYIGEL